MLILHPHTQLPQGSAPKRDSSLPFKPRETQKAPPQTQGDGSQRCLEGAGRHRAGCKQKHQSLNNSPPKSQHNACVLLLSLLLLSSTCTQTSSTRRGCTRSFSRTGSCLNCATCNCCQRCPCPYNQCEHTQKERLSFRLWLWLCFPPSKP